MEPMKPMKPMAPMSPPERWWPADLGDPSTVGAQDEMRYAFFPAHCRLIIERYGKRALYDTGKHLIGGVSQAASGTQSIEFSSQLGVVNVSELARIDG